MDSYIRSADIENTDLVYFYFQEGKRVHGKKLIENQKMIWMNLTPNPNESEELNKNTINKLINLIRDIIFKLISRKKVRISSSIVDNDQSNENFHNI